MLLYLFDCLHLYFQCVSPWSETGSPLTIAGHTCGSMLLYMRKAKNNRGWLGDTPDVICHSRLAVPPLLLIGGADWGPQGHCWPWAVAKAGLHTTLLTA